METLSFILVGCLSALFLSIYLWARRHYSYWQRKGIKFAEPRYFWGNSSPLKIAPGVLIAELYGKYANDKYVGFYEFSNVKLLINDPVIVQNILIKDFSHFTDRGNSLITGTSKENDGSIFSMTGAKWRAVRNKLSPTFTSGKLKVMVDQMLDCYNNLVEEITDTKDNEIEARDLMFSYTLNIVASCAFGLDITKDKKAALEFRSMGLKALQMGLPKLILLILFSNLQFLKSLFRIPFVNKDALQYFGKVLTDVLKYRRQSGVSRNDFLQLLIQLKEKGSIENHMIEPEDEYLNIQKSHSSEKFEFTERMLLAQAFTFITAGMEPSGNTLTLVLSELAYRQEIQNRLRTEIQLVLAKHDNQFTYQSIKEMEYLENTILETLRLYPVGKQIRRMCTKKYQMDDGLILDVGTEVVIPTKAIQSDPRYYSNPNDFNPDRFKEPTVPGTFFAFGDGPRICIGMRFAMLEMKVAIANLVINYRMKPGKNFKYPIPLNKWSFFSVPAKPVKIRMEKI